MKITFTTPTAYSDGTPITADDATGLTYAVLIDTVNPPVTSFDVPAANVAAGTVNPDGSKTVTVDAVKDLGFVVKANVDYFLEAQDSLNSETSDPTNVLTYRLRLAPAAPGNFSVA